MLVLEFKRVPAYEKVQFHAQFQSYLEELDLTLGDPIDPDLHHRYPTYDQYFENNPNKQIFSIFLQNSDIPPESPECTSKIGFFFLDLTTPKELKFLENVPNIYEDEDVQIALLNDFYIKPKHRNKGIAQDFYHSIIRLCTDPVNEWHCVWECDTRNIRAIKFYDKILDRLKKDTDHEIAKNEYVKNEKPKRIFSVYQIKFDFDEKYD